MVWRNTSYNGNYVVNLLGGKEFKVGERSVIGIGGKVTAAGGKRYGFVDIAATNSAKEILFMDSMFNEHWKPVFKQWFYDNFGLEIKTIV